MTNWRNLTEWEISIIYTFANRNLIYNEHERKNDAGI